jgi:hypothetical protein
MILWCISLSSERRRPSGHFVFHLFSPIPGKTLCSTRTISE